MTDADLSAGWNGSEEMTNNSSEWSGSVMRETCSFLVAMRFWETPVHIPNTMVKTKAADDTILVTVWESRWRQIEIGLIAQPVRAHA